MINLRKILLLNKPNYYSEPSWRVLIKRTLRKNGFCNINDLNTKLLEELGYKFKEEIYRRCND